MGRLALYVDGFNFYHAVNDLNRPHLKWVDLHALANLMAHPSETVVAVKYFSAYATWLSGPYRRHREYVKALEARGVEVTMAHFKERQVRCNRCGNAWISREEKETDVHLALKLLADADDDIFDRGMLVTADSDLVPVVRMVKARHPGKTVAVAAPPKRYGHGRHLQQVADSYFQIGAGKLAQALLPEVVHDSDGRQVATRPKSYTPPAEAPR